MKTNLSILRHFSCQAEDCWGMLTAAFTMSSDLDFQKPFKSVNLWNFGGHTVTHLEDLLQKTELPVTEMVLSGKPKNLSPKAEIWMSV